MLPQEAIRAKRDGQALDAATLHELVAGIAGDDLGDARSGRWPWPSTSTA